MFSELDALGPDSFTSFPEEAASPGLEPWRHPYRLDELGPVALPLSASEFCL